MRKLILFASCLALLGGCTPTPGPGTLPPDCGITANTLADEKALYAAESVYNVAATAYLSFDETGLADPKVKARAQAALVQSYAALKVARDAYAIGRTCDFYTAVAKATNLANQAKSLLPN